MYIQTWHLLPYLIVIQRLFVIKICAQNIERIFDLGLGHAGQGGGLLEANETLFSGAQDNKIKVWNVSTGALLFTITGHTNWVNCFAVIDEWLFSGAEDDTIRQWQLGTFAPVRTINVGEPVVALVAHQGSLFSGGESSIKQWDINTGTEIRRFSGHAAQVTCLVFHDDLMFSAAQDFTVRMWNLSLASPTPITLGGSN